MRKGILQSRAVCQGWIHKNLIEVGGLNSTRSNHPSLVGFEHGFYGREEIQLGELLVGAEIGTVADEAELVAILEPEGDLLDGGLLQVVRAKRLDPHSGSCRA